MRRLLGLLLVRRREHRTRPHIICVSAEPRSRPLMRRLPQRSMEAHRKGKESAAAARAAAEAAGEDQAAQEQAAKEAFDREDDRTPEERETFKQVCGLCRRHRTSDYRCSHAFSQRAHARPLAPRRRASSR